MKPPISSPTGDPKKEKQESGGVTDDVTTMMSDELCARIVASNYGRDSGWIVEYNGQPIALFTNSQYWDMFWDIWEVTPQTQDENILVRLQDGFFFDEPGVAFRNRDPELVHLKPAWEKPIVQPQTKENWKAEWGEFPTNCAVVRGLYLFVPDLPSKEMTPKSLWSRLKLYLLGGWYNH